MSELKCLPPEMDNPIFLRKITVCQIMPTRCKGKDASFKKEQMVEVNIRPEILNQINAKRIKSMNLFPSRPLMGYNWYKWEDRGHTPNDAADRLYRNMKNTPPSIYSLYSLDSSAGLDSTQSRRSRRFPSLRCNIRCLDMKDQFPSNYNSQVVKQSLPLLPAFSGSHIIETKTDKGSKRVEKRRVSRRLPFPDERYSSGDVTRKRGKSVFFKEIETLESASNKNGFWVMGQSLKHDMVPYIPRSFSVSHNEYMAHFQSTSDESDDD